MLQWSLRVKFIARQLRTEKPSLTEKKYELLCFENRRASKSQSFPVSAMLVPPPPLGSKPLGNVPSWSVNHKLKKKLDELIIDLKSSHLHKEGMKIIDFSLPESSISFDAICTFSENFSLTTPWQNKLQLQLSSSLALYRWIALKHQNEWNIVVRSSCWDEVSISPKETTVEMLTFLSQARAKLRCCYADHTWWSRNSWPERQYL